MEHKSNSGPGHFHSVEVMADYEGKSAEEIRYEDYRLGRRGTRPSFVAFEEDASVEENFFKVASASTSAATFDGARPLRKKLRYQSITLQPFYADLSFEELRVEDYFVGRKGGKISGPRSRPVGSPRNNPEKSSFSSNGGPAGPRRSLFTPSNPPASPSAATLWPSVSSSSVSSSSSSTSTTSSSSSSTFISRNSALMIFARVSLGLSTPGKSTYTRPPPLCEDQLAKGKDVFQLGGTMPSDTDKF